jgi:hypothetical protein
VNCCFFFFFFFSFFFLLLYASSGILEIKQHSFSETGSASDLRRGGNTLLSWFLQKDLTTVSGPVIQAHKLDVPEDGSDVFLHGVISQKTGPFITTAVRTSNPT